MSKIVGETKTRPQNQNLKPFKKWERPPATGAQKSAWRDRKRQAQKIMDMVIQYQTMTTWELKEYMEKHKDELTVLEYTMMKYVTEGMKDKKIMLDMIDRHISKAPIQTEISWLDWWSIDFTTVSDKDLLAFIKNKWS